MTNDELIIKVRKMINVVNDNINISLPWLKQSAKRYSTVSWPDRYVIDGSVRVPDKRSVEFHFKHCSIFVRKDSTLVIYNGTKSISIEHRDKCELFNYSLENDIHGLRYDDIELLRKLHKEFTSVWDS